MNIFFLHTDPRIAARLHADGHVNKMLTEYTQILSCAYRYFFGKPQEVYILSKSGRYYKKTVPIVPGDVLSYNNSDNTVTLLKSEVMLNTHDNHPCCVWARTSTTNYAWLLELWSFLHDEWIGRFDKPVHGTFKRFKTLRHNGEYFSPIYDKALKRGLTVPYCAMPTKHIVKPWPEATFEDRLNCVVDSYESYYIDKLNAWHDNPKQAWRANYTEMSK